MENVESTELKEDDQKILNLNTGSITGSNSIEADCENEFFGEGSATVIRKSNSQNSPNSQNSWKDFEVTTNPVVDERFVKITKILICCAKLLIIIKLLIYSFSDSFVNLAVMANDRNLYNPYGEADDLLAPVNSKEGKNCISTCTSISQLGRKCYTF